MKLLVSGLDIIYLLIGELNIKILSDGGAEYHRFGNRGA